jgi:hypothetical protein
MSSSIVLASLSPICSALRTTSIAFMKLSPFVMDGEIA